MNEHSYWLKLATRVPNIEEQRYCYIRCIELDEENYEARALLLACGPGAARAPAEIKQGVVLIEAPPQIKIVYVERPIKISTIVLCCLLSLAAAALIVARLQGFV